MARGQADVVWLHPSVLRRLPHGDSRWSPATLILGRSFRLFNHASPTRLGGLSHVDYSRVFAPFEAAGGKWVPTFNLAAFLLGPLWYFLKGMWLKGIVLGWPACS